MRNWDVKRVVLVWFGGLSFATSTLGQTPPPNQPREVIKATGQTVLVDVVVGDRSAHPVPGLKKGDFTILEDGKPQPNSYFEVHGGAPTQVGASHQLPEGMYSSFPT